MSDTLVGGRRRRSRRGGKTDRRRSRRGGQADTVAPPVAPTGGRRKRARGRSARRSRRHWIKL